MNAKTKRWFLAAAAAAVLGLSATGRAASFPSSGGPGALGTSVPFDSRVAREYFNYHLPTSTPEALRIRDQVQALHAGHRAAVELGRAGAGAQAADVRALVARVADEQGWIDWTLVEVCKDSLLALDGPAQDAAAQEHAAALREALAAPAAERDARLLAATVKLLEGQVALVDALRPQAKEALRQQLGSVLERERKLLTGELASARALAAKVATAAPAGGRG